MKLCINCEHLQWDDVALHHKCKRTTIANPVDGAESKESCIMERSVVGTCGPTAKFFQEKQPNESERG